MKYLLLKTLVLFTTVFFLNIANAETTTKKHYGEELKGLKTQKIEKLLSKPEQFSKADCAVEGVVEKVCEKKGCWLTLKADGSSEQIRIGFKDYGFFVGKDIIGKRILAEGRVQVKELKPEQIAHLKSDGDDNVKKTDVSFVASGLRLVSTSTSNER